MTPNAALVGRQTPLGTDFGNITIKGRLRTLIVIPFLTINRILISVVKPVASPSLLPHLTHLPKQAAKSVSSFLTSLHSLVIFPAISQAAGLALPRSASLSSSSQGQERQLHCRRTHEQATSRLIDSSFSASRKPAPKEFGLGIWRAIWTILEVGFSRSCPS